jgi:hypothetical protein
VAAHLQEAAIVGPFAALRFQTEHSNALWRFHLSPSDLKQIECPPWVAPGRGAPTLMMHSIVDDRGGVAYLPHLPAGKDGRRPTMRAKGARAPGGRGAVRGNIDLALLRAWLADRNTGQVGCSSRAISARMFRRARRARAVRRSC